MRSGLTAGTGREGSRVEISARPRDVPRRYPWVSESSRSPTPGEVGTPKPYLFLEDLPALIPFSEGALRTKIKRGELVENVHFFRRGRRLVFKWSAIVDWLEGRSPDSIPLYRGGEVRES